MAGNPALVTHELTDGHWVAGWTLTFGPSWMPACLPACLPASWWFGKLKNRSWIRRKSHMSPNPHPKWESPLLFICFIQAGIDSLWADLHYLSAVNKIYITSMQGAADLCWRIRFRGKIPEAVCETGNRRVGMEEIRPKPHLQFKICLQCGVRVCNSSWNYCIRNCAGGRDHFRSVVLLWRLNCHTCL